MDIIFNKSSKSFNYFFYGHFGNKLIESFVENQEQDLEKILRFLKIENVNSRLIYKIFSTLKEKRQADPYHSASRACARVGEKSIYRVLGPEMNILSFPHEIVHLMMHEISPSYNWEVTLDNFDGKEQKVTIKFDSISFLQEGVALLIDEIVFNNKLREDGEYRYLNEWAKYNHGKHNIKVSELIEFYEFCGHNPLYATPICGSFCMYLFEKYGLEKFLNLYKSCSELNSKEQNIDNFRAVYDKGLDVLEAEWRHRVDIQV